VLTAVAAPIRYCRDGDVVLNKRPDSAVWQRRYRLLGGAWQRVSTGQRNLVDAELLGELAAGSGKRIYTDDCPSSATDTLTASTTVQSQRLRSGETSELVTHLLEAHC
jgi:hypothetical protein